MEQEPGDGWLTVGVLARRSGLTAKALRHYDRVRLLRPAAVGAATGYRLYRSDQVAEARLVPLLRSLDLPEGAPTATSPPGTGTVTDTRLLAAQLFNETWTLMEQEGRTRHDDDRMMGLGPGLRLRGARPRPCDRRRLRRGRRAHRPGPGRSRGHRGGRGPRPGAR